MSNIDALGLNKASINEISVKNLFSNVQNYNTSITNK